MNTESISLVINSGVAVAVLGLVFRLGGLVRDLEALKDAMKELAKEYPDIHRDIALLKESLRLATVAIERLQGECDMLREDALGISAERSNLRRAQ